MYPHDMYPHDMYPHDSHKHRLFGTERSKWLLATNGMRATGLDLVLIRLELRPRWFNGMLCNYSFVECDVAHVCRLGKNRL
jgi:hypothetical protein